MTNPFSLESLVPSYAIAEQVRKGGPGSGPQLGHPFLGNQYQTAAGESRSSGGNKSGGDKPFADAYRLRKAGEQWEHHLSMSAYHEQARDTAEDQGADKAAKMHDAASAAHLDAAAAYDNLDGNSTKEDFQQANALSKEAEGLSDKTDIHSLIPSPTNPESAQYWGEQQAEMQQAHEASATEAANRGDNASAAAHTAAAEAHGEAAGLYGKIANGEGSVADDRAADAAAERAAALADRTDTPYETFW